MSGRLAALQDALATLVTDGAVTDGGVRGVLAGLAAADVTRYARGLRRKRWDDVAATVPLSARVIGQLEARYDTWLAAHPATARDTVLPPGAAEALRALDDLARDIAGDPGEAPWAAELLAFEALAAGSRADGGTRALRAEHAVHAIAEELRAGLIPIDPPRAPHAYTFDGGGWRGRRLA